MKLVWINLCAFIHSYYITPFNNLFLQLNILICKCSTNYMGMHFGMWFTLKKIFFKKVWKVLQLQYIYVQALRTSMLNHTVIIQYIQYLSKATLLLYNLKNLVLLSINLELKFYHLPFGENDCFFSSFNYFFECSNIAYSIWLPIGSL